MRTIAIMTMFAFAAPLALAEELGEHGFAKSGDVSIHYVTAGKGPLVIMLHGFPDYWYSWRHQMPELAKQFQVVAIDNAVTTKATNPKAWRTTPWTSCSVTCC